VELVAADVATVDGVARVFEATTAELSGVVHLAGVLRDALAADLTDAQIEAVLAPKLRGARLLARALADRPSVRLVLFSSAAGLLGTAGQSAYAAANAGLDALAYRRLNTVSVAWGPWAEVGMAHAGGVGLARIQTDLGLRALSPERAVEALGRALDADEPVVAVLDADWSRTADAWPADPLVAALAGRVPDAPGHTKSIRQVVEEVLGRAVVSGVPLVEQGLDSLRAVQLRDRLAHHGHLVSLPDLMEGDADALGLPSATPQVEEPAMDDVHAARIAAAVALVLALLAAVGLAAIIW